MCPFTILSAERGEHGRRLHSVCFIFDPVSKWQRLELAPNVKHLLVKSNTAKLYHSLGLHCLRRQSPAPFKVRPRCIHNSVSQLHLPQFRFSVTAWLVPAALESSDRDYQQDGSEGQLTSPDSELVYVIAHSTFPPLSSQEIRGYQVQR